MERMRGNGYSWGQLFTMAALWKCWVPQYQRLSRLGWAECWAIWSRPCFCQERLGQVSLQVLPILRFYKYDSSAGFFLTKRRKLSGELLCADPRRTQSCACPAPLTFELLGHHAALVVGVVDDGRRGGRAEALLGQAAPVPLLARQHALLALPLIQVIPRLRKVHVQPPHVLLVRAGAQPDAVACRE